MNTKKGGTIAVSPRAVGRVFLQAVGLILAGSLAGDLAGIAPARAQSATPMLLAAGSAPAGATVEGALDPAADAWKGVAVLPILLNRTPPLLSDGPFDDGARPTATVQLLRFGETTVLRIQWTDATANVGPVDRRLPDAGAGQIYKQHSQDVESFADAVCIMVPERRGPGVPYPSLMMGEVNQSVELYYWRADKGFRVLAAHGRTTTQAKGGQVPKGIMTRAADGYSVTMAVPNVAPETPVAFAIWDGAQQQRDGLKYFSPWYEVR